MGQVVRQVSIGAGLIALNFVPGLGQAISALWGGRIATALFGIGSSVVLGGVSGALRKPQSGTLLSDPRGRLRSLGE